MKKIYIISAILMTLAFTACEGKEEGKSVCVPYANGVSVTISVTQPDQPVEESNGSSLAQR
jgi:uncharacterized lipoprotein YehR (DUF1307 family)